MQLRPHQSEVQLRPYQREAIAAFDAYVARGGRRGLIVLPTASGKTVIFAQLPKTYGRTLVLAHREELLEQSAEKLAAANPDLRVAIEQASRRAGDADVVVASVPTLGRKGSKRLAALGAFDLVICDEVHHAAAETWQRVLDHHGNVPRLGVTATPQRGDRKGLVGIFDEVVYYRSLESMIDEGWLVAPVGWVVRTDTDLGGVRVRAGDYVESDLAAAIDNDPRNDLAVAAYRQLAAGRRAVTYCVTVEHATHMAAAFNRAGIACAVVVGTTPTEERRSILAAFKADAGVSVISSVGVLTEGWDDPGVSAVILARPTRSPLLYTQIIGRGLRLAPGKVDCLVIDLADATVGKRPVGLPSLLGLPAGIDCQGKKVTEVAKLFRELEVLSPAAAAQVGTPEEIQAAFARIDLFKPPPLDPEILAFSRLVWMELGADKWILNVNRSERLAVKGTPLGTYQVGLLRGGRRDGDLLHTAPDMAGAFGYADTWVRTQRAEDLRYIDTDAPWRDSAPTDKQLAVLERMGIPVPAGLTRGEASRMLDKAFAENRRPAKAPWLAEKIAIEKAARNRF